MPRFALDVYIAGPYDESQWCVFATLRRAG